jgi:hypothetical protein
MALYSLVHQHMSASDLAVFLTALDKAKARARTSPAVLKLTLQAGAAQAVATPTPSKPGPGPTPAPKQQNAFEAIAAIFDACIKQWVSPARTCIVDALDPANPTDGTQNPDIMNALGNESLFSPVAFPSSMPSDPITGPTADQQSVRAADLKSAIGASLISTTSAPASPNPDLEGALHAAYNRGPVLGKNPVAVSSQPVTVTFTNPKYGGASSLTLTTTMVPPSVLPPNGQMAQFISDVKSTAHLNLDLMLGQRQLPSFSKDIGSIEVQALLDDPTANNQPTITISSSVLGIPINSSPAVTVHTLGPTLEYVNSSTNTQTVDACGITQPVFVVYGISMTVTFQCELSMGYGAYVDAQIGIGRVVVMPGMNAYLIGALDTSALGGVVAGNLTGRYNLLSVNGQAGLYTAPVRDFFPQAGSGETGSSAFYALEPYAYGTAVTGGSVVTFSLSILHLQTEFVLGLTPAHSVPGGVFPANPTDAASAYAVYLTEIPNAPQGASSTP